jgi:Second Messenger Oligonucleotide or Dinucleotide Synthetase domain/Adenylyl/Guanylyl and SMODS C-terminal sensor domain
MKLVASFTDFLKDTVNLNQTRIDLLDDSVEAIKRFIWDSDWQPKLIEFAEHGSWAHKTIIRPVDGNPFDADLLAYVEPVDGWEAKQYVDGLAKIFQASGIYKDKLRVYAHCVTIEYSSVRKIDIAPCVMGRVGDASVEVCNKFENSFQASNPEGYTEWIAKKNSITGNHGFRKTTRLLKFMRDIKTTFTCPSFLLTTLLGLQIYDADKDSSGFSDVPSTLKTIVGRLDDWLQARPAVPMVANPALLTENQSHNWTDIQYSNFREKIHLYRGWIDDAFVEGDADKSVQKWRKVLGDEFGVLRAERSESMGVANSFDLAGALTQPSDVVDLVRKFGIGAIGSEIEHPPHRHPPVWQLASGIKAVRVAAELCFDSNFLGKKKPLSSGTPLLPNHWIEFSADYADGSPLGTTCRTEWRVTNNGAAAAKKSQLRGGFYRSDNAHSRSERLAYRGVHLVEAFVVRMTDDVLIGQSQPFFVVIE